MSDFENKPVDESVDAELQPSPEPGELREVEGLEKIDFSPILEALLFSADKPVSVRQLVVSLQFEHPQVDASQVREALVVLREQYEDPERRIGRGFELKEISGGWIFQTASDLAPYLRRFSAQKPQKLSRAALETLAIVAYRQPATRPQVDEVRGVDSSSAVRFLLDKQLIRVLGKSEELGRPLIYGTTPEFLQLFGLKNLSHLPTLKEYQELNEDNQGKVESLHGPEPVRVIDLVTESETVVSDETEDASLHALDDLEDAVTEADQRRKETDVTLSPEPVQEGPEPSVPASEEADVDDNSLDESEARENEDRE